MWSPTLYTARDEGKSLQLEQHLPRVLSLKQNLSPIILVVSLGVGAEVLLVGGGCDFYSFISAPPLAGCRELVNPGCSLVNFTVHLKQKAQVPPEGEKAWRAWGGRV